MPAKADRLVAEGARLAPTIGDALRAGSITIICVSDYPAVRELFDTTEVGGTTLLNLTSGDSAQARETARWCAQRGAHYLDGAIMSYPKSIGTPECTILFAGSKEVFAAQKPLLLSLGGNAVFVGERISTACVLDSSLLSFYYGAILAFLQGAALCEAEDVSLDGYLSSALSILPVFADTMKVGVEMIHKGNYAGAEATLDIHAAAFAHIRAFTHETGVDRALADCLSGYFTRAVAAGHGQAELPAVFESFRKKAENAETE